MELHGTKVYLDIDEQMDSDCSSPIDLATFPLHDVREATDAELDRLEAMATTDDDELTNAERASLPANLERVRKKSKVIRGVGVLSATCSLVYGDPAARQ